MVETEIRQKLDSSRQMVEKQSYQSYQTEIGQKLDINYTVISFIRWKKTRVMRVIRTTLDMSN